MSDIVPISTELDKQGFKFYKSGLQIVGDPTFKQWEKCGELIKEAEGAIHWWIGDWLNYGEKKWGEMYAQVLDKTDFTYQTIRDDKWIANRINLSFRDDKLTIGHGHALAPLIKVDKLGAIENPEVLQQWLDKIKTNNWSIKDLREEIRNSLQGITKPQPLPEGKFEIIYADPPWKYEFSETLTREIENQYPTMTWEEIMVYKDPNGRPIQEVFADNAVLYLWTTAPKVEEAIQVMNSWGFKYRTNAVWDKEVMGMGYWFRIQHELLLVGLKGTFPAPPESLRERSVYREKRGEHSAKPKYFQELIDKMYPNSSRLELFSRNKRDGWTVWGNQIQTQNEPIIATK